MGTIYRNSVCSPQVCYLTRTDEQTQYLEESSENPDGCAGRDVVYVQCPLVEVGVVGDEVPNLYSSIAVQPSN